MSDLMPGPMSDVASSRPLMATVVLTGHLLDSLTLSKVIDKVETLGGDYELNDIQIGSLKKDISSVSMTVYAPDEATRDKILEEIRPYGAVEAQQQDAEVCAATRGLPENALHIPLPSHVRFEGQWLAVDSPFNELFLTVCPSEGKARVLSPKEIESGDFVVIGHHGVKWERGHA